MPVTGADHVFRLRVRPAITNYAEHAGRRVQAAVALEIAAKYAERVGGEIHEHANVSGCAPTDGSFTRLLASYPSQPLMYEALCPGYRALFLGGD